MAGLAGMLAGLAGLDLLVAGAVVVLYRLGSFWFVIASGGRVAAFSSVSVGVPVTETPDR